MRRNCENLKKRNFGLVQICFFENLKDLKPKEPTLPALLKTPQQDTATHPV